MNSDNCQSHLHHNGWYFRRAKLAVKLERLSAVNLLDRLFNLSVLCCLVVCSRIDADVR